VTTHAITIEIDDVDLSRITDERLALCWHVAQANPAPYGDHLACDLAERIGREIIRRWLKRAKPELWHHQGSHSSQKWLSEFAVYQPGEGYKQGGAFGDDENTRRFHSGRWVLKDPGENPKGTVQP
jgi:hypothetical protein